MISRDPEDIVEIDGVFMPRPRSRRGEGKPSSSQPSPTRGTPWKMVWFTCCHVYGRIYRNATRTKYSGQCPRCSAEVYVRIGVGGTSKRIFRAE